MQHTDTSMRLAAMAASLAALVALAPLTIALGTGLPIDPESLREDVDQTTGSLLAAAGQVVADGGAQPRIQLFPQDDHTAIGIAPAEWACDLQDVVPRTPLGPGGLRIGLVRPVYDAEEKDLVFRVECERPEGTEATCKPTVYVTKSNPPGWTSGASRCGAILNPNHSTASCFRSNPGSCSKYDDQNSATKTVCRAANRFGSQGTVTCTFS